MRVKGLIVSRPQTCLAPLVAALGLTLALPPFDVGWAAWVALAPMLHAMRRASGFAAAAQGFLFGMAWAAGTLFWRAIGWELFGGMAVLFSLYYALFGAVYRVASRVAGSWILVAGPSLWVALEYARANVGFLAWPTNLLGFTQYRFLPFIQVADLTGVYGVSFLLVLINHALSRLPEGQKTRAAGSESRWRALDTGRMREILAALAILVLALLYGRERLAGSPGEPSIRVALVQPNVLVRNSMPHEDQLAHLQVYRDLTEDAARDGPELIVWPSSSLPAPIHGSRLVRVTLEQTAQRAGAYLVVGGAGYEKLKARKQREIPYANSEFLISPVGQVLSRYHKRLLVPFNESLPFEGIVRWPSWITTAQEGFQAGETYTLFRVGEALFGTPICWENMFADYFRRFVLEGANLMVSVANEAVLGSTNAPYQTLAMTVFRAVENRVAVVRATTTGISAFIEPSGAITGQVSDGNGAALFVRGVAVRDVPLARHRSVYTVHGDWFVGLATAVAALALLRGLRPRPRLEAGS